MKKQKIVSILTLGILSTALLLEGISARAAGTLTKYDYTGKTEVYVVPEDGLYEANLCGAQGGNFETYVGGNGGYVKAILELKKGDTLYINVGGQNGYNGGGKGAIATGGGATDIRLNGTELADRILVAGGGGGASEMNDGYTGSSTENLITTLGNGESAATGSGGGGGYYGGKSGSPIYHQHTGNNGTVYSNGTVLYTTTNPGGCFAEAGHTHGKTGSCPSHRVQNGTRKCGGSSSTVSDPDGSVYDRCSSCGAKYGAHTAPSSCWNMVPNYETVYDCGYPTNTWKVCGKTSGVTVDAYASGYGGSNYIIDSAIMLDGGYNVNKGNGHVTIEKRPTIKFDYNKPSDNIALSGADIKQQPVIWDSAESKYVYGELPAPSTEQYTFLGWSLEKPTAVLTEVEVTEGSYKNKLVSESDTMDLSKEYITLYAMWSSKSYNLTLVNNLANAGDGIFLRNLTVFYGYTYKDLPDLQADGYNFLGWYTEETAGTKINKTDTVTITQDTTYYAHWQAKQYTVTFNENGGTLSGASSKTVTMGKVYGDLPTASKSGVRFIGWFTSASIESTLITSSSIVTNPNNHTLYAVYEPIGKNEFPYTGTTQWYTIPEDGYYKLEAYGAQGSSYDDYAGGKGGYTHGVYYFTQGTKIQIEVGGSGGVGGYNGGGASTQYTAGGGATDFRVSTERIMIAGGGGGASPIGNGGDGGTTTPGTTTKWQGEKGPFGGGGGYYGGKSGYIVYHQHTGNNVVVEAGTILYQNTNPGGCFVGAGHTHNAAGVCKTKQVAHQRRVSIGEPCSCSSCVCPQYSFTGSSTICSNCGHGHHVGRCGAQPFRMETYYTTEWDCGSPTNTWEIGCGKIEGVTIDSFVAANGGSSWMNSDFYYTEQVQGQRTGNGLARITPLYEYKLDLNRPTTTVADVNATNIPEIIAKDTINRDTAYKTPIVNTVSDGTYTILLEDGQSLSFIENITELPQPTLKGWTFTGWYTEANYKTSGAAKIHNGTQWKIATIFKATDNMRLLGNKLYAHWDENEYYIRYYMNNTDKNIYGDTYSLKDPAGKASGVAKLDTAITRKGNQDFRIVGSGATAYYEQKCLYDHDIEILQNLYSKTGYFFNGWTNAIDSDNKTASDTLADIVKTGVGTGKKQGAIYKECETLKPIANGETFQADKGNFNFITDAKQHETDTSIPKWNYSYTGKENGSDTVILYATWEPIRYSIQYNGTENWNTEQKPYKETEGGTTLIRYDQTINLDANKFTRNAPYDITTEDGTKFTLKSGYKHVGWGFGQDTRQYATSPSWNLLQLNTKADYEQGFYERDYAEKQTNVVNALSADSIKGITQYILDWGNARTVTNIADKTEIRNKEIIQNLHSIWRRVAEGSDPDGGTDGDVTNPDSDNYGIRIKFNLNGGYFLQNNEEIHDTVVIKQETFNDYFYVFDITGAVNEDLLHKRAAFDSYSTYDATTGINNKFYRIDNSATGMPVEYRFLGWSVNPKALYPDNADRIEKAVNNSFDVYNADGDKNKVNLDVYSANKNEELKVYNDLTLYAVWETIPSVKVMAYKTLGGSSGISDTIKSYSPYRPYLLKPGSTWSDPLLEGTKNAVNIKAKAGEKISYTVYTFGLNMQKGGYIKTEFDKTVTDIYSYDWVFNSDTLNRIGTDGENDTKEAVLKTSNLNRLIDYQTRPDLFSMPSGKFENLVRRTFYVPTYLGTKKFFDTEKVSNYKESYPNKIIVGQYSYFKKGFEEATVYLNIVSTLDNSKPVNPGGGDGDGGGDSGGDSGSGDTGDYSQTVLDELRTKLRIRLQ